jgi:hypothetical protein
MGESKRGAPRSPSGSTGDPRRLSSLTDFLHRSIMRAVRSPILASRLLSIVVLLAGTGALNGCAGKRTGTSTSREAVVHQPCPQRDLAFMPSTDPRTATVLVPFGPSGVLVCRYWGGDDTGRPWTLAGRGYTAEGSKLAGLVAKLDALKPFPTAPAPSCPVFGGRSILLLFQYRDASDDPVRILRRGCVSVSNGRPPSLWGEGLRLGEHWPDEGVLYNAR